MKLIKLLILGMIPFLAQATLLNVAFSLHFQLLQSSLDAPVGTARKIGEFIFTEFPNAASHSLLAKSKQYGATGFISMQDIRRLGCRLLPNKRKVNNIYLLGNVRKPNLRLYPKPCSIGATGRSGIWQKWIKAFGTGD